MLRAFARFALFAFVGLAIIWLAMSHTDDSFADQCAKAYPSHPDRQVACLERLKRP